MGVDVHRGTDIGVAQQLLVVFGSRTVGERVTRERVPKLMEMEALKPRHLFRRRAANQTYRAGSLIAPIRAEADEGDLPVILRDLLGLRQV